MSNKKFFKKNRDGTITFRNLESLNKFIKKKVEEESITFQNSIMDKIYEEVSENIEIVSRDVLNRFFGFGKVRQDRFIEEYNKQIEMIIEGYLSLNDLDKLNKGEIE